jgi:hypothetical protein
MTGPAYGSRAFVVLWGGQFVSLVGSALTSFALGVRVYQLTGSVTKLGLVYTLAFVPQILVSPVAGALVDRWGRKRALLLSNGGAMIMALSLAALLATHSFAAWNVYIVTAVNSMLAALQLPAFGSAVPLLVPKQHIGRANGMLLLASSASQVLAPAAAGALLLVIKIQGVVLLDCLSFGVAILTLLAIRIPQPPAAAPAGGGPAGAPAAKSGVLGDFAESWRYVAARRGLVGLLVFFAALNLSVGFADVLITPLVLAFASTAALGAVLSVGGIGMVGGSVAMSIWGGPRRRVTGVLGFSLLLGVAFIVGSLRPSVPLIAAAAFVFLGSSSIINVSYRGIWQTKVEQRLQGRVLALQNMVTTSSLPVAYLLAGPLASGVFEPLAGRRQARPGLVAALVGHGADRGIALLLLLLGVVILLTVAGGYLNRHLRDLEDELPDAVPDMPAPTPEPVAGGAA